MKRHDLLVLAMVSLSALGGCRTTGEYFWVESLPAPKAAEDGAYEIGRGDLISIRVWNQENMSVRARVRSDGRISIPFLHDVEVAGQVPADLARRLAVRLKDFVVNPTVTVTVEEVAPLQVSVLGEVARPGVYQLDPAAGVLQALAAAGGMTQWAGSDDIFVVRGNYWADNGNPARIRFRYDALARGEARSSAFRLHPGDVVVVE